MEETHAHFFKQNMLNFMYAWLSRKSGIILELWWVEVDKTDFSGLTQT